jgi:hypothetical protein
MGYTWFFTPNMDMILRHGFFIYNMAMIPIHGFFPYNVGMLTTQEEC